MVPLLETILKNFYSENALQHVGLDVRNEWILVLSEHFFFNSEKISRS